MTRTCTALAAFGLCLVSLGSVRAQGSDAASESKSVYVTDVRVGFDERVVSGVPTPVWVTLENRFERSASLRIVARTHNAQLERFVELPAGSRRRLCLGLTIRRSRVLLEVQRDGEVVEQRLIKKLKTVSGKRLLLCVDGRDDGNIGTSHTKASTLPYVVIPPRASPTEAACYGGFGAVLLRNVDPDAWTADQRAALVEFALLGGVLIVADVRPQFPDAVAFVDSLPAAAGESEKLFGRPVEVRPLGLGRVLLFPDDPLAAAVGSAPGAAQVMQDFGTLIATGSHSRIAPLYQGNTGVSFGELPGLGAKIFVGVFVLGYLLVVGPVLAISLRKSTRRRLAVASVAVILGFSFLAFLVAGAVRTGDGRAYIRELLYVPQSGPALLLGDVTVISGGATSYDLSVRGPQIAATLLPTSARRERSWSNNNRVWEPLVPDTVRTARGAEVSLEVAMKPWGVQTIATMATLANVAPLDASLKRSARGYEVTIRNTTGSMLRRATIVEQGVNINWSTPFVSMGDLAPGETATAVVKRGVAARAMYPLDERKTWYRTLDLPMAWETWASVAPTAQSTTGSALRYQLLSRPEPRLRCSGDSVDSLSHALRIDPIRVEGGMERGFMGITVEVGSSYTFADGRQHKEIRVASVLARGPAKTAGVTPGLVINSVNGQQVTSVAQFQAIGSRYLPGEKVKLECWDPDNSAQRTITLKLVSKDALENP